MRKNKHDHKCTTHTNFVAHVFGWVKRFDSWCEWHISGKLLYFPHHAFDDLAHFRARYHVSFNYLAKQQKPFESFINVTHKHSQIIQVCPNVSKRGKRRLWWLCPNLTSLPTMSSFSGWEIHCTHKLDVIRRLFWALQNRIITNWCHNSCWSWANAILTNFDVCGAPIHDSLQWFDKNCPSIHSRAWIFYYASLSLSLSLNRMLPTSSSNDGSGLITFKFNDHDNG